MMQVPPAESMLAGSRSWPLWLFAAWAIGSAAALLSIWLGRHRAPRVKVIWTVLVVAVPVAGALAWFVLGRERKR
jgi:Phospholipase_D-nuclease N-terminal